MTKTETKRYYPTPALEKGLDILELFASTPEGLTVSEVARRLERTVSEIFRMILCLEQRGWGLPGAVPYQGQIPPHAEAVPAGAGASADQTAGNGGVADDAPAYADGSTVLPFGKSWTEDMS